MYYLFPSFINRHGGTPLSSFSVNSPFPCILSEMEKKEFVSDKCIHGLFVLIVVIPYYH